MPMSVAAASRSVKVVSIAALIFSEAEVLDFVLGLVVTKTEVVVYVPVVTIPWTKVGVSVSVVVPTLTMECERGRKCLPWCRQCRVGLSASLGAGRDSR